jgi:hypothetical protein
LAIIIPGCERNPPSPLEDGDVEVYAKPSDTHQPLHAHRVTDAAQLICESKMGEDLAIQYHRNLLQCTHPGSTRSEYGTVVAHFRYDHDRYEKWRERRLTISTGRVLKRKVVAWTPSGRPAAKNKVAVTESGRITKKGSGGKRGSGKVRQAPSYTTSGKPDPRVVARQHPPETPPGGFRRLTVRPIRGHFPPVKAKRVAHPPPAIAAKDPPQLRAGNRKGIALGHSTMANGQISIDGLGEVVVRHEYNV